MVFILFPPGPVLSLHTTDDVEKFVDVVMLSWDTSISGLLLVRLAITSGLVYVDPVLLNWINCHSIPVPMYSLLVQVRIGPRPLTSHVKVTTIPGHSGSPLRSMLDDSVTAITWTST